MLPEILSRETQLPVLEIADGTRLEPDHVYVMSAYTPIELKDDTVFVVGDTHKTPLPPMPIDHFFQVLAEYSQGRTIGVILSGTASDGARGLLAIKAAGGVTIVQTEASARYDSMPHSAIAAGAADLVLEPGRIGHELKILARMEARQAGADEAILLNHNGHVAEGSADNVFVVRDQTLLSPPCSDGALDGITRAVVLQLAAEAGYTAQEAHLTTYDLYTADECFLTGTGAEMIPVRTVDGRPLGSCPGPVFQDLQQRFRDLIEVECGKNSRQTATPDRLSPTSPRH